MQLVMRKRGIGPMGLDQSVQVVCCGAYWSKDTLGSSTIASKRSGVERRQLPLNHCCSTHRKARINEPLQVARTRGIAANGCFEHVDMLVQYLDSIHFKFPL